MPDAIGAGANHSRDVFTCASILIGGRVAGDFRGLSLCSERRIGGWAGLRFDDGGEEGG